MVEDFEGKVAVDGLCFGRHLVAVEEDWTEGRPDGYSEDWAERVEHWHCWHRHLGLLGGSSARPLRRRLRRPIPRVERRWRYWSWTEHLLIVMRAVFAAHSVVVAR